MAGSTAMAKLQRRSGSVKSSTRSSPGTSPEVPVRPIPTCAPAPPPPQRSTYVEAVAIYEQAIRTLQQHNYAKAAELLRHVVTTFPEERELVERARLYVTLCERHLTPLTAEPQNTQERLYAATLALNAGEPDSAVAYLEAVRREDPSNDQALYMLAVAHAERGQLQAAIPFLQRAIEANPENRALARLDPDLEDLRDDEVVIALLDAPPGPRTGGRPNRRR